MNNDVPDPTVSNSPATCSTACPACRLPLNPSALSSEVILTTLGERRYYHRRCLQRVARIPGPFPLEAA